jgi:hypothetical protein
VLGGAFASTSSDASVLPGRVWKGGKLQSN